MKTKDDNDVLHFSVMPNLLLKAGGFFRGLVQSIFFVRDQDLIEEAAAETGFTEEEVTKMYTGFVTVVSRHFQAGHGIESSLFRSKPTIKGNIDAGQAVLRFPDQYVDFNFSIGKGIRYNPQEIATQIVASNVHVPVVTSAEDGVTETDGEFLTVNGTLILEGQELMVTEENEDEGVFFLHDGDEWKSPKLYVNINRTLQARIPNLAPNENYQVEVRKRYPKNKKLFATVYPKKFVVEQVSSQVVE